MFHVNTELRNTETCNSLKAAEVKICLGVSHGKASPSVLEITLEF